MAENKKTGHVAVFPFPFGSHPLPLFNLVLKLSHSAPNLSFSFISTQESNKALISKSKSPHNNNIKFYNISDGVPEDHVPARDKPIEMLKINLFLQAAPHNLQNGIDMAVQQTNLRVTCIIADAFVLPSFHVAQNLAVPWLPFWPPFSCCLSVFFHTDIIRHNYHHHHSSSNNNINDPRRPLDFLPGLNMTRVEDLPEDLTNGGENQTLFSKTLASLGRVLPHAEAVIMNHFEELDPPMFVSDMRSKLKSILYVGFLTHNNRVPLPPSETDATGCLSWLDKQGSRSVAYVSFGTVVTPPEQEIVAVAEALEESGFPFLWSLKEHAKKLLPEGFIERTENKGKVVPWCPQSEVLGHASVGVFVTHCGCNSVLESISGGVPLICRPFFGDQRMGARIVEDVWKIGVRVVEGGVLRKDRLVNGLNAVMVGEEGKKMRENAQILKKMVMDAASPQGKAARDFTSLINDSMNNQRIKTLVSNGLYHQTFELFRQLHFSGHHANILSVLPSLTKACSSAQCHAFGTSLHCLALKTGSHFDPVVSNSIISMYAKFMDTESARKVFDTMPQRDPITWNSMINCYLQNGRLAEALQTLKGAHLLGLAPKLELMARVLSMCGRNVCSRIGKQIHALVIVDERVRQSESLIFSTALVDFYFRCRESWMALHVFDGMEMKNEVTWTAIISGCTANHRYDAAFACFRAMQAEGVIPESAFTALLTACAEPVFAKHGKEIHGYAFHHWFASSHSFSSALINMYCQCGESLHLAELVFEGSSFRDVVLWSSIIGSYAQRGDGYKAIKLFNRMLFEETKPNHVTLLEVISACTNLSSLKHGCQFHGYVFKFGFSSEVSVGNALINMYAKCGCVDGSSKIFLEMPNRDSVSWSTLISAYGLHGCGEQALQLFHEMKERRVKLDSITLLAVLSACNHAGLVSEAQLIFKQASADSKIQLTLEHYACLIDLLGRSGKLEDAMETLRTMPMEPSARMWSSLVSSCKLHRRLDIAEILAPQLIRSEPKNAANYALLNMIYAEHGHWLGVEKAREIMKLQRVKKTTGFSRIEAGDERLL
ncbi:hypothetical protein PIB30_019496 [Stylosanthes scabra]|uniref:Uncharacterized protein n=1 Tax=Stylosanthes scabra TaxID=79078 RepID=A0ABU6U789_9FABA|nr:hypothetical protein [Stylosanthes scabra]